MKHDEQLALFDGARNKLKQLGIKPNISELKQVENDLAKLKKREADLEKKYDSARKGRNPQTGKEIKIAASKAPKFKAGKALKDLVNIKKK